MEKKSNTNYPKSTLFTREYLYTTSCNDIIEFKALTFRELDNLHTKYLDMPNSLKVQSVKLALINKDDFNLIPSDGNINELYEAIINVSTINKDEYDSVVEGLNIQMDKTFEADNFRSCQLCQDMGLDTLRNCPMLDKETHSPSVKYITNNKIYSECPMYNVNNNVLMNDAIEAYLSYRQKVLPMEGGLVDQTSYFYRIAPTVKNIIEAKQMEDTPNK